ncbi:MAG TPA: hypothetical protein PK539_03590 [Candidatus Paceibacterota bacterium]|nr:hypothetical protein [Candidatus Paceibacterota bacterium]
MPLRIANQYPERRELQAYVDVYKRKLYSAHGLTGIFSPKFELKCRVSLEHFKQFCLQQEDIESCHINPFPQIAYWSYNVWEQGEIAHPGLKDAAQQLLNAVGINIDIASTPRHSPKFLAYSNFWVGSAQFWRDYVGKVLVPISDFLDEHPNHPAVVGVLKDTTHTDHAPFLPFVVERLYSTWLSQRNLGFSSYEFSQEIIETNLCNNQFERLLFCQMRADIDLADVTGRYSPELRQRVTHMCQIFQQHFFDYYASRPHPHSGKPIQA